MGSQDGVSSRPVSHRDVVSGMSAAFALRPNTLAVSSAVLKSHALSKLNRLPRLGIDRLICAGPSIKYSLIRLNPEITTCTPPANTPKTKPCTSRQGGQREYFAANGAGYRRGRAESVGARLGK